VIFPLTFADGRISIRCRRDDVATDLAATDTEAARMCAVIHGGLADRETVFGVHLAVNLAVDSGGAFERNLTGDFRAAIQISAAVGRRRSVRSWSSRGRRRGSR